MFYTNIEIIDLYIKYFANDFNLFMNFMRNICGA